MSKRFSVVSTFMVLPDISLVASTAHSNLRDPLIIGIFALRRGSQCTREAAPDV